MKLRATHSDGFTEHLVTWVLAAEDNRATIVASWIQLGGREEKTYTIGFPDSRIEEIARALTGLEAEYDGHMDDFPSYSLQVSSEDIELKTVIRAGSWSEDEKPGIEAFMAAWRPLSRDVDDLLALPGRR